MAETGPRLKVDKPKHIEMKRYDATDGGPLF